MKDILISTYGEYEINNAKQTKKFLFNLDNDVYKNNGLLLQYFDSKLRIYADFPDNTILFLHDFEVPQEVIAISGPQQNHNKTLGRIERILNSNNIPIRFSHIDNLTLEDLWKL